MKTMLLTVGIASTLLAVSGCRSTQVAGVARTQEEQEWEKIIRANYPGYRPAPVKAPAVYDNTEDRISRPRRTLKSQNDPVQEVKKDAETPVLEPIAEAPAAVEAEKAPETADVKAPAEAEKPAETADVKAPAEAEKASESADVKAPAEAEKPAAQEKAAEAKSNPPEPTASTVYVVKSGDTLGKISQQHYGSARHSNMIFKANSDILKNPNLLRPGMKLIIPKL